MAPDSYHARAATAIPKQRPLPYKKESNGRRIIPAPALSGVSPSGLRKPKPSRAGSNGDINHRLPVKEPCASRPSYDLRKALRPVFRQEALIHERGAENLAAPLSDTLKADG